MENDRLLFGHGDFVTQVTKECRKRGLAAGFQASQTVQDGARFIERVYDAIGVAPATLRVVHSLRIEVDGDGEPGAGVVMTEFRMDDPDGNHLWIGQESGASGDA